VPAGVVGWELRDDDDGVIFHRLRRTREQQSRILLGAHASDRCEIDGRHFVETLLNLKSPSEVLEFLNHYGRLEMSGGAGWLQSFRFTDVTEFQQTIKDLACAPISAWERVAGAGRFADLIWCPKLIEVRLVNGSVQGVCKGDQTWMVCASVLWFDKAAGAESRVCERSDCQHLYRVESQQRRKYCSPECAHVCAVRESRRRARKAVAKARRRSPKA
jgi:hypothetical protein